MAKSNRFILIFLAVSALLYGQDIYTKYLDEARAFYLIKDYDKALSRIQFVLKSHDSFAALPEEEKELSENIYYSYLKGLSDSNSNDKFSAFASGNPYFKQIAASSSRINELKLKNDEYIAAVKREEELKLAMAEEKRKTQELEDLKRAADEKLRMETARLEEERRKELDRIAEAQRKEMERIAQERKIESERLLAERKRETERVLEAEAARRKQDEAAKRAEQENFIRIQEQIVKERMEAESSSKEQINTVMQSFITMRDKETQGNMRIVIIVTVVIGAIFIAMLAAVIILFIVSYRNSRRQQETFMKYAEMAPVRSYDALPSPVMSDVADAVYRIEDRTSSGEHGESTSRALPSPEDHDKEKLRIVVEQCKAFGEAIDSATHRKNCSKNAAELVYKISVLLGRPTRESMIYYAVGLIYDIGFLSTDPALLDSPKLTDEQFELVKKHTTSGLHMIHFVDKEYKQIFIDGITKHHENMDGSGYPENLKAKDIPFVARVIRVVDSYVSLISQRAYRDIYDKETAFKKLIEDKGVYDEKILEALSNVI